MIKTLFDNLNEVSASDFATVYKNIFDSGILCPFGESPLSTTALKVTNSSGNVAVGNGSALIKGRVITVSSETVTLPTDGTYKIVLEWSAASDSSTLKAISGSLVQTDTQYQILLATVIKSGTSLTITDGRSFINRMTDNQAITLQTAQQTGWSKVEGTFEMVDYIDHDYGFGFPSTIASVLQFGTKVKFTQDSIVKYATVKSITVSGETATIYFDSDVEITSNTITDFYCSNSLPMGFPSNLKYADLISAGTWSPTIGGETTKGTMTYTTRNANYSKFGKFVHCEFYISGLNLTGSSGVLAIQDLPFNPASLATATGGLVFHTITSSASIALANIGNILKVRLMSNGSTYYTNTSLSNVGMAGFIDYICE